MKQKLKFHLKNVKDQIKKYKFWVLGRCRQCSSSFKHFKGIRTNTSAPIKERITRASGNLRILEKTCTCLFCHCLCKWLCIMLCCVTLQTLDKNEHKTLSKLLENHVF